MIRREFLAHIIAYNLQRALMHHGKSVATESASFKGTIDRLNHWQPIVLCASSAKLRKRRVTDLTEQSLKIRFLAERPAANPEQ